MKDTTVKRKRPSQYKEGDILVCTYADTRFYTVGKHYKVVENEQGETGVIGNDGIFDSFSTVVSRFTEMVGDPTVGNSRDPHRGKLTLVDK